MITDNTDGWGLKAPSTLTGNFLVPASRGHSEELGVCLPWTVRAHWGGQSVPAGQLPPPAPPWVPASPAPWIWGCSSKVLL